MSREKRITGWRRARHGAGQERTVCVGAAVGVSTPAPSSFFALAVLGFRPLWSRKPSTGCRWCLLRHHLKRSSNLYYNQKWLACCWCRLQLEGIHWSDRAAHSGVRHVPAAAQALPWHGAIGFKHRSASSNNRTGLICLHVKHFYSFSRRLFTFSNNP
jgi:hypothetical protein